MKRTLAWIGLVLTVLACERTAPAQNFAIDAYKISGGGGASTGGVFAVSGTIGQPDAGQMSGGQYSLQGGFWSTYIAVQTTGAPTLSIKRVGNTVEISWPADAPGFVLEETANLAGTISWLGIGTAPAVVDGRNVVTLPVQAGHHFFRLRLQFD